jgi:predicted phage baseplate assembly protein
MPPTPGDALYLAFDTPLARLLVHLDVDASPARGAGVDPEDPPLRWEVPSADGNAWLEARVLEDLTGGFNYGSGRIVLDLPGEHGAATVAGQRAYWLRCRLDRRTRSGEAAATYSQAPEIYSIAAGALGARIPASHSARVSGESLGESDGTAGQLFHLQNAPVLELEGNETLEVLEPLSGEWQPWELRESFVESGSDDRHFVVDLANGVVELGPAVWAADGAWKQYGAVPPAGARLRFTSYRHGGGRKGNVAADTLTMLKAAIPGVASVTNPRAALGGVDAETLESARHRASMEIRTRYRAVTAEDFEFLCGEASPRVARALCTASPGAAIRVHIVPQAIPADRRLERDELVPDEALFAEVAAYLDERRLIGTTVQLVPARYRGVSVVVNVQASLKSDLRRVEDDVAQALYTYLNPLVGGSVTGAGTGWEFGRPLNQGELFGVVHSVEGVEFVKILRVYETNLETGKQDAKPAGTQVVLEPDEVVASGTHIVKAEYSE